MVTEGSLITLYVATSAEDEPVDVPNLIGMTVSVAEKALKEVGLELDTSRTEYRSSTDKKGTIIGYENIGQQVAPGTKIAVYVSTGELPTQSTTESTTESTTAPKTEPSTSKPTTTTTKPTSPKTEPSTSKPESTRRETTLPSQTSDNVPVIDE